LGKKTEASGFEPPRPGDAVWACAVQTQTRQEITAALIAAATERLKRIRIVS
jgi:hypothetical protein